MWQFNLNRVIYLIIPRILIRRRFLAWLKVSLSYLFMILDGLRQFRDKTLREAKMTPQIAYLEHFLNDRYGTGSQIFISEGYLLGPWCWYGGPPAGEVDFYAVEPDNYCYSDNVVSEIDFVVNIPRSVEDQTQQIAAMVQKYKLAGKSFIIQIY
jgi:hypothetical protein